MGDSMVGIQINELETPFQTLNPVRPEYIRGREDIIKKMSLSKIVMKISS